MGRISHILLLLRKYPLAVLFFILSESLATAGHPPVLNIFLVQNSGWMEPFYTDPNSQFKHLIQLVIKRTTPKDGEVVIAGFNQSIGKNRSPILVYQGKNSKAMIAALQGIKPAMKPGGKVFADTDFKEAVSGSISQYSPGRPCILWVFTNNKNSPNNSSSTAERNSEFYQWLQREKSIKRIVATPFSMPVKGKRYKSSGIMVYAVAYGTVAGNVLKKIAEAKLPFGKRPARLKPLDAEAVTFVPIDAARNANFSASIGADKKTLVLKFESSNRPEVAVIKGLFTNALFPYDIRSADVALKVKFQGESHGIKATVEPPNLVAVPSGIKNETMITVRFRIPPLPSMWRRPEIIFKSGCQIPAVMTFILTNQKLQLSPDFKKRMNEIFPGDPLPDIFIPGEASIKSETASPLLVKIAYPTWPLIVLALLIIVLLAGAVLLMNTMTRSKKYTVVVDGTQKLYRLKPFSNCPLYDQDGERIGTLKRRLGKPLASLDSGRNVTIRIQ